MAVALLSTPASMTAAQYDRVSEQLEASRAGAPPGRRFHVCFGQGDHLMVFEVWDNVEDLHAFATTLIPILADEQIELAPAEPLEVHRLVDSGESGALRKTIAELREKAFFIRPVEKLRETIHKVKEKSPDDSKRDGTATSES
jgi:hypothetical protein